MSDAPSPQHLLRSHSSSVSALHITSDNERIYSSDASGQVVITSTRTLRAIASWKAHSDGLLGVEEWVDVVITHGRDNKLHVWDRPDKASIAPGIGIGGSAALPGLPVPSLRYSMDVNALNYCRFSLLRMPIPSTKAEVESPTASTSKVHQESDASALIALPNLVESSEADIWSIPSCTRIHAAIGNQRKRTIFSDGPVSGDGRTGENATGIIMSLHLYTVSPSSPSTSSSISSTTSSSPSKDTNELRILIAYESGVVTLRRYAPSQQATSVEGKGWDVIWTAKVHKEAIMAMQISLDNTLALSVSADHLVGRYDLTASLLCIYPAPLALCRSTPVLNEPFTLPQASAPEGAATIHRTKHPGNGCVAIRDDGRVCAIGGWDGRIRLYSTKSFKPLGTLRYHKTGVQALVFARFRAGQSKGFFSANTGKDDDGNADDGDRDTGEGEGEDGEDSNSDDEMSKDEKVRRKRWLVSGAKDDRVSIWELMDFAASSQGSAK